MARVVSPIWLNAEETLRTPEQLARARAIVALVCAAYEADGHPNEQAMAIFWVLEWALGDDANGFNDFIAGEEAIIQRTTAQFTRHAKN